MQVIHINDTTPVDFILIVSCSFLLNFERSLLFNVHSQLYNNYIKEIFISLVTSTWHSTWNGWHAFLTFVVRYNPFQRKYLIHQQNLMTHLLLIVFWFRRRSFIFRFDHSFLILPQIKTLTLSIIHLLWYFRIMISVFMCTRRDKSKNTSINAKFITVKRWQQEAKQNMPLHWSRLL